MKDTCLKLIELAKRATHEWEFERQSHDSGYFSYELNTNDAFIAIRESEYEKMMQAKFDADFIGQCNPQTITALCERLLKLEEAIDKVRKYFTAMNAPSQVCTYSEGVRYRHEAEISIASLEKDLKP